MKRSLTWGVVMCAALIGLSGSAYAQSALPIPDGPVAKDIPGAKELPDPSMTYKIVFDIGKAAEPSYSVNPALEMVVRVLNTLAKNGVPADHRKIAVVFHRGGTSMILKNEEFKARNSGHDNPNIAMIQSLSKAGVDFRVCGQSMLANKIDAKSVLPEVEEDLWAMTTMLNLQLHGYVHVGGGN